MIQRIQTLWLFLAAIATLLAAFSPLVSYANDLYIMWIDVWGYEDGGDGGSTGLPAWGLLSYTALCVIVSLVAIFLYANRKRQLRWVKAGVGCNLLWYVACAAHVYYAVQMTAASHVGCTLHVGLAFPVLAIVFLLLAHKAIKHDEALVRAADRIR